MSGSESVLVSVLTVVSMRATTTFADGQKSEIDRYEVLREDALPGFGMGMIAKLPEFDMM